MRAVISVDEHGDLILKEVYSGVGFVTRDGEEFSISMRDTGYEFKYFGKWYSAQGGIIKELLPETSNSANHLVGSHDMVDKEVEA